MPLPDPGYFPTVAIGAGSSTHRLSRRRVQDQLDLVLVASFVVPGLHAYWNLSKRST